MPIPNPLHIIEGYTKKMLSGVNLNNEETEQLAALRLEVCKGCHALPNPNRPGSNGPGLINEKTCDKSNGGCGCDMTAKVYALGAACPVRRW